MFKYRAEKRRPIWPVATAVAAARPLTVMELISTPIQAEGAAQEIGGRASGFGEVSSRAALRAELMLASLSGLFWMRSAQESAGRSPTPVQESAPYHPRPGPSPNAMSYPAEELLAATISLARAKRLARLHLLQPRVVVGWWRTTMVAARLPPLGQFRVEPSRFLSTVTPDHGLGVGSTGEIFAPAGPPPVRGPGRSRERRCEKPDAFWAALEPNPAPGFPGQWRRFRGRRGAVLLRLWRAVTADPCPSSASSARIEIGDDAASDVDVAARKRKH